MEFPSFIQILFYLVFAGFALHYVFNVFRRGGFKGAAFNARIEYTVGEIDADAAIGSSKRVKVHVLDRDGEALVGLEVASKTIGSSHEMLPVTLSPDQARQLCTLLERAMAGR